MDENSVGQWAGEWLSLHKSFVKESTYCRYKWIVNKVIIPRIGDLDLMSFGNADLQKFAISIAAYGYGAKSISSFLQCIRQIMKAADINGMRVQTNYSVKIPKAYDSDIPKPLPTLSEIDAVRLMTALVSIVEDPKSYIPKTQRKRDVATMGYDRRYAMGCLLGIGCGLRIGEACGISREDIDLDAATLSVRHTVYEFDDNGHSEMRIGPTKTIKSARCIPIPEKVVGALTERLPSGYLIPGGTYQKEIPNKRGLAEWFKGLLDSLGIPRVTFHGLRHTYATRLLAAGVDIKVISELLGHSDVKITMQYYLHPDEIAKLRAVEKINW